MSLKLYLHPLSSYCHKVLIALYENDTPFEPVFVDLGDPTAAATIEMKRIWPVGMFPVLRDEAAGRVIPESSIIIEYLDQHHPGPTRFIPADPDLARQTRLRDRFCDLHLHSHMQKIGADGRLPEGDRDPLGAGRSRRAIIAAYGMLVGDLGDKTWLMGEDFTLADCAAAPALFYASKMVPFGPEHASVAAYLDRLMARPSYARALKEAEPYFAMFAG